MCTLCCVTAVVTNVILGIKVGVVYFINLFCISMNRIVLTGISHNTLVGTSGSGCYSALVVMTKLCNLFLSNKNLVTSRALLALGKTLVGTGGSYGRESFLGMRKLFDRLCVAIVARAGKGLFAFFCTGGSLGDLLGVLVGMFTTKVGNVDELFENLTARKRNHKSTN